MTSTVIVRAHNAGPVEVSLTDPTDARGFGKGDVTKECVPAGQERSFYIHSNQAVSRIEEVEE